MPNSKPLRILYFMHVDWGWAKQRPHFLSEFMAQKQEVLVCYPFYLKRDTLVNNSKGNVKTFPLLYLPFSRTYDSIKFLNNLLQQLVSWFLILWFRPDLVWITSPEIYEKVIKLKRVKYLYDCMDNMIEFEEDENKKKRLTILEKSLIDAAVAVFCSSNALREKLIERYGFSEKYHIIYNALDPASFPERIEKEMKEKGDNQFVIGYIGTISKWFDFQAIYSMLEALPEVKICLVGPADFPKDAVPRHNRLEFLGPVPHNELYRYMAKFDAVIMPFIVNNLILCVDPVKFYEYIYFNKPVIAVKYPEVERFEKFVDFYNTPKELIIIVEGYLKNNFQKKYTDLDRENFIHHNTWKSRVKNIEDILEIIG